MGADVQLALCSGGRIDGGQREHNGHEVEAVTAVLLVENRRAVSHQLK